MRFLSLRALFLLGFVIAMPVLALPPVARWMDELLYGLPPGDFGSLPATSPPTQEAIHPLSVERVSPAGFDERNPAADQRFASVPMDGLHGLDAPAAPPPLAPLATFSPLAAPQQAVAEPEPKIDEQTIARLKQVRQRLEELGAEYVIVETESGSGRYRFHCRMLVDERSRLTQSFNATSADPIAAAEQVLREVETWRTAAVDGRTRQR